MLTLKVFLSSPGDVAEERRLAVETLQALEAGPLLRERVNLVVVAWDDPVASAPLDARETPQHSVNRWSGRPADCDLTIVVLWSRLGTPLPPSVRRADGSRFDSGTVWEVEDAIAADRPVFVYRRTEKPRIELDDPDLEAKRAQYSSVRRWFDSLRDGDGAWRAGVNEYATPVQFQQMLRAHLESFIVQRLAQSARAPVPAGSAGAAEAEAAGAQSTMQPQGSAPSPHGSGRIPQPPAPGSRTDMSGPGVAEARGVSGRASLRGTASHDDTAPPQLPGRRGGLRRAVPVALVGLALLGLLTFALRFARTPEAGPAPAATSAVAEPAVRPRSDDGAAVRAPPQSVTAAAPSPSANVATPTQAPEVRLSGPAQLHFAAHRASTYTVLALLPETATPEHWRLRMRVRLATAPNSGGMNFWDSSFRLLVDGVPRAPGSNLNELVDSGAAKDGEIFFDVPWGVQTLALRVNHYGQAAELPLAVSGAGAPRPRTVPKGPREVTLDGPAQLTFPKSPPAVYTVLGLVSEARRPGVLGLRVWVRMQVMQGSANFSDAQFRLLVDGVPIAPDSNLNEVVEGGAAKDGDITFELPDTAQQLVLRIRHSPELVADVPLKLERRP